MRKIFLLCMLIFPLLCLAASGNFVAQGNVKGLPISKDQMWEIWSSSSKDEIVMKSVPDRTLIEFKKRGNMSVNGALCYDAYVNGQKTGQVWIYISVSGYEITKFNIETHYGTTYFK